jgi:hypothetical protein
VRTTLREWLIMTGGAATAVRCIAQRVPGMVALFSMKESSHDLSFVMQRIAAGDRARFFHSHFGQQVIELSRSWIWIFKRKTRVSLSPLEIARVKDAMYTRHKVERERAAITDAIEAWCAGQRERSRKAKVSRP